MHIDKHTHTQKIKNRLNTKVKVAEVEEYIQTYTAVYNLSLDEELSLINFLPKIVFSGVSEMESDCPFKAYKGNIPIYFFPKILFGEMSIRNVCVIGHAFFLQSHHVGSL